MDQLFILKKQKSNQSIIFYKTSMKKYQNWLQNRHYKHHLDNLHKISYSKHSRTLHRSTSAAKNHSPLSQNLIQPISSLLKNKIIPKTSKRKNDSYFVFYQNSSHNLTRINTEFDINQENYRMAQRLANVRPTVSRQKHRQFYEKSQIITKKMMKKMPTNQLREKSLNNFFASEKLKKISPLEEYVLILKFQQQQARRPSVSICSYLPQRETNSSFRSFFCSEIHENVWFLLDAGRGCHKASENVQIWQIQHHSFVFGFQKPFSKKSIFISLYHSIKLTQGRKIGDFQLILPELGQSQNYILNHPKKEGVSITLKMIYGESNSQNIKSEIIQRRI